MKKLPIRHVREGDFLALDLYTEDYRLLLNRGTKLSNTLLLLLRKHSIRELYIEDEETDDILYNPIEHQAKRELHKKAYQVLHQYLSQKEIGLKFTSVDLGREFEKISESLLNYIAIKPNVLHSLYDLHLYGDYILQHSLNVGMISGVIGQDLGLEKSELINLMIGAMLADIGMTLIPKHILTKKGPLSFIEKKVVKSHTKLGYELLKKERNIPQNSAICALSHHERLDGSGYPNQLSKDIPLFARIVAVADVYEALTTSRPYRELFSKSEAVEYLYASAQTKFDTDIIQSLLRCIAIFPVGSTVQLNNGLSAIIVKSYPEYPLRPLVRVTKDLKGGKLSSPIEVDLRKHTNITIVS